MDDNAELLRQAAVLKVERRPEACLGCGFEHGCSVHGCAVMRRLIELAAPDAEAQALIGEADGC